MALTDDNIKVLYDAMSAEQDNWAELQGLQPNIDTSQQLAADLNTPSTVAEHRLMRWLFAVAGAKVQAYVKSLFDSQRVPQLPWFKQLALNFQLGYALSIVDGQYYYATIDESAKIIKFASPTVRSFGPAKVLVVKVAKDDGSGSPAALTNTEINAFNAYLNDMYPMISYLVVSANADILKYKATIYYDPLVLAPDGSLLADSTVFPVHDAVNNYAKFLTNGSYIDFDGKLQLNKLEQAIGEVPGVVNYQTTECKVKVGTNPYMDVFSMVGLEYRPIAGYMAISTTPGETLDDLLTFVEAI